MQKKTKIIIGILAGVGALLIALAAIIAVITVIVIKRVNKPDAPKPVPKVEKKYTVSFDTDGGSEIASIKVKGGEVVSLPESPVKEGYIFSGWTLNDEIFDATLEIKEDITLKASWISEEKEMVTVKFNTDGGEKLEPVVLEKGSAITLPKITNKKGYAFVKWVDSKNNQVKSGDKIKNDVTLKAIWKVIENKTDTSVTPEVKPETKPESENNQPTKTETISYTCPEGYKLSGTTCTKKDVKKATSTACPSGTHEIDGKCVTVTNSVRVDSIKKCPSKNVHVGKGSTPIIEGQLKFAGYSYCVYGVVTDSYEQENRDNCTARGHVWVNSESKCYYESDTNYTNSCNTGYTYVSNPISYGATIGGGCFPVQDKPNACPDDSYKLSTDPYLGKICTKTITIDATKVVE